MQLEAIRKGQHFEIPALDELDIRQEKITLNFDYEAYLREESPINNKPHETKKGSLQSRFNEILGDFAKNRVNVSIGEDRKLLTDALWDKYGQ
jgi:hypothetical protein